MIVKLRRAGLEGSYWVLSRQGGGKQEWLEQCADLDALVPSGLAWADADFTAGRWMVRRVIAALLPAVAAPIASSTPRERQFRLIVSA